MTDTTCIRVLEENLNEIVFWPQDGASYIIYQATDHTGMNTLVYINRDLIRKKTSQEVQLGNLGRMKQCFIKC